MSASSCAAPACRRADLRIGIELVAAGTGSVLWANSPGARSRTCSPPRTPSSSPGGGGAGRARSPPAGQADSIRRRPANPAAFDLVLQGIFHAHQTEPAATATALGLFTEALALEPDYPWRSPGRR
ncbi:MAG: hypothetical protein R3D25_14655 [Geminicoccaceae bacterium]